MSAKKTAVKSARKATANGKSSKGFSDFEREAMKERARELKAEAEKADGETALLEQIAKMSGPDRAMAKKLHALIKSKAPSLASKTWYGMPAYANRDGKVVCFFQAAEKFKARYATLGFSDQARLDEGRMWPTSYALSDMTPVEEEQIVALLKKAVS